MPTTFGSSQYVKPVFLIALLFLFVYAIIQGVPENSKFDERTGFAVSAADKEENFFVFRINPGTTKIIKVTKSNLAISRIHLDVTDKLQNIQLVLGDTGGRPGELPDHVGVAYIYLEIVAPKLTDDVVDRAKLDFSVPKPWFETFEHSPKDVRLLRYKDGWIELATRIMGEDENSVFYQAISPGLSFFAIVAIAEGAVIVDEPDDVSPEKELVVETDEDPIEEDLIKPQPEMLEEVSSAKITKETNAIFMLLILVVLFVSAVVIFKN